MVFLPCDATQSAAVQSLQCLSILRLLPLFNLYKYLLIFTQIYRFCRVTNDNGIFSYLINAARPSHKYARGLKDMKVKG